MGPRAVQRRLNRFSTRYRNLPSPSRLTGCTSRAGVRSAQPACVTDRPVVVFRQIGTRGGGDDRAVFRLLASSDGKWSTGHLKAGRFYAKVKATMRCGQTRAGPFEPPAVRGQVGALRNHSRRRPAAPRLRSAPGSWSPWRTRTRAIQRRLNRFSTRPLKPTSTRHGVGVLRLRVDREGAELPRIRKGCPMGHAHFRCALGCALVVAAAVSGLGTYSSAASSLASSRVTIGFQGNGPRYLYGTVTSTSDGCEDLRKVVIFKQRGERGGGDDIRFGSSSAFKEEGQTAWWSHDVSASTAGRFYAKVRRTDQCERDASATIRVEAKG